MPVKGALIGPNLHKRNMRALRWVEGQIGTTKRRRRHTPAILGGGVVRFELLENHPKWQATPVRAARRTWVPTASNGDGGFVSDCEDILWVMDYNGEGFEADVGGMGKGHVMLRENEPKSVLVIFNLCCLGDEIGVCPV